MLFSLYFYRGGIFNLRVDSSLGRIIHPLSYEYLIFLTEEIRSLPLSLVVDPVPLEVVSASLGENSVSTALAHIPHALVDISIGVDHTPLAVRKAIHPHAIIPIASLVEHGSSALLGVALPIPSILPPQLVFGVGNPEGALAVPLVFAPSPLILIPVGVILNPEAILLIILPVPHVFVGADPFIGLLRPILVEWLLLHYPRATFTQ